VGKGGNGLLTPQRSECFGRRAKAARGNCDGVDITRKEQEHDMATKRVGRC
jgi:hypothetical protein